MSQRRALGDAGGAAGVLQERDVLGRDRDRAHLRRRGEDRLQRHAARQVVRLDHLLDLPGDEIDDRPLEAHQVAGGGDDDGVELEIRPRLLDDMGEVLDHHQRACTGIVELVGQFAGGVERIDIDHGEAAEQRAEDRRRIGEDIRHHQRDAVALLEALRLQPGGEGTRRAPDLGEGDGLAEALESLAIGVGLAGVADQVGESADPSLVDHRRHGRGIMRQPGARIRCNRNRGKSRHPHPPSAARPVAGRRCRAADAGCPPAWSAPDCPALHCASRKAGASTRRQKGLHINLHTATGRLQCFTRWRAKRHREAPDGNRPGWNGLTGESSSSFSS